jgi:EpsI family protein
MDMIGNTTIRIGIVAAVVMVSMYACYALHISMEPAPVELPAWTFHELPAQIGDWHGEPTTLDPKIVQKTGAVPESIEDRAYHDDLGHTIMMHTAMFNNPTDAVYHIPTNCYRAAGWQQTGQYRETLQISEDLSIPVLVTTWEHENEHLLVVYWLQLGEYVLFDRSDLGWKVRRAFAGRPKWPAMLKVQLSLSANDLDEAKQVLVPFAEEIAKWENQPAHRTGLVRGATRVGGDAAPAETSP